MSTKQGNYISSGILDLVADNRVIGIDQTDIPIKLNVNGELLDCTINIKSKGYIYAIFEALESIPNLHLRPMYDSMGRKISDINYDVRFSCRSTLLAVKNFNINILVQNHNTVIFDSKIKVAATFFPEEKNLDESTIVVHPLDDNLD